MSADDGLQIGRRVKARKIAHVIRELGGGVYEAQQLTDDDWINADRLARGGKPVRRVPSPETRALVIEYLALPDDSPRDEDVRPER